MQKYDFSGQCGSHGSDFLITVIARLGCLHIQSLSSQTEGGIATAKTA